MELEHTKGVESIKLNNGANNNATMIGDIATAAETISAAVQEKLSPSKVRRRIEDLLESKRHRDDDTLMGDFDDFDFAID